MKKVILGCLMSASIFVACGAETPEANEPADEADVNEQVADAMCACASNEEEGSDSMECLAAVGDEYNGRMSVSRLREALQEKCPDTEAVFAAFGLYEQMLEDGEAE